MVTKNNVATKRMGNFDMASAADRVLAFWEKYPKGKISTEQSRDGELLVFKTYIWKEKKDYLDLARVPGIDKEVLLSSADSEGTAKQGSAKSEKKDFEKLETISVGRALALLGFGKDGQIASTEEMEEFYKHQENLLEDAIEAAVEYLDESNNIDDLKDRFISLDANIKGHADVVAKKNALKLKFDSVS